MTFTDRGIECLSVRNFLLTYGHGMMGFVRSCATSDEQREPDTIERIRADGKVH